MDTTEGPIPLCCIVNGVGHCVKCYRRYCRDHAHQLKAGSDSYCICICGTTGDKRWRVFNPTTIPPQELVP